MLCRYTGNAKVKRTLLALATLAIISLQSTVAHCCPVFDGTFIYIHEHLGRKYKRTITLETTALNGQIAYRLAESGTFYPADNIARQLKKGTIKFSCSASVLTVEVVYSDTGKIFIREFRKLSEDEILLSSEDFGGSEIYRRERKAGPPGRTFRL